MPRLLDTSLVPGLDTYLPFPELYTGLVVVIVIVLLTRILLSLMMRINKGTSYVFISISIFISIFIRDLS